VPVRAETPPERGPGRLVIEPLVGFRWVPSRAVFQPLQALYPPAQGPEPAIGPLLQPPLNVIREGTRPPGY
jgi:hypothetical protein